jgi:hypothetical protein
MADEAGTDTVEVGIARCACGRFGDGRPVLGRMGQVADAAQVFGA